MNEKNQLADLLRVRNRIKSLLTLVLVADKSGIIAVCLPKTARPPFGTSSPRLGTAKLAPFTLLLLSGPFK
jgi:hypothetical protein